MQKHDRFWLDMIQTPSIFPSEVYEILDIIDLESRPTKIEQLRPIAMVTERAKRSHLNCSPPPAPKQELPRVYTTVGQTIPCRKKGK